MAVTAGAALLATPAPAADKPVPVLEPATGWTLNLDPEQCALLRDFGPPDNRLRMQIESYGSQVEFRVLLAGKPLPKFNRPSGEMRYRLSADAVERNRTSALEGTSGKQSAMSFGVNFTPFDPALEYDKMPLDEQLAYSAKPKVPVPEFENAVTALQVHFESGAALELHLGKMEKPLAALRGCVDDLQRHWGLDPALQKRLTRYPVPDPSSVRKVQRNYPQSMVLGGQSAFVPIRIGVDAAGQATGCVVQIPGIEDAFREAVCDNLARTFAPALDEAGRPVASIYRTSVVYMITP
jgi:hypothetical protein